MSLLDKISTAIDLLVDQLGGVISWLTLAMVLLQFAVVMMRYVFGIGAVFLQEAILYMHATVFVVGAGFTLLHNGHVRVDVLYARLGERQKALIDLCGALVLLAPVCGLMMWSGLPFVRAAWAILEGSTEASGIQAVFLLKSLILVYAGLLIAQGASLVLKCLFVLAGARPALFDDDADDQGEIIL